MARHDPFSAMQCACNRVAGSRGESRSDEKQGGNLEGKTIKLHRVWVGDYEYWLFGFLGSVMEFNWITRYLYLSRFRISALFGLAMNKPRLCDSCQKHAVETILTPYFWWPIPRPSCPINQYHKFGQTLNFKFWLNFEALSMSSLRLFRWAFCLDPRPSCWLQAYFDNGAYQWIFTVVNALIVT